MDKETSIHELKEKVKSWCEARDWDQFHNAKDLAVALSIEVSELLEHFRWKTPEEENIVLNNPEKRELIEQEVADIFYFLLRFAQKYDIDLTEAFNKKMEINSKRYPIERFKGSNRKYNQLE